MLKRMKALVPGDVVQFATRPDHRVAEVKPDRIKSRFYPHREYPIIRVRWEGNTEFTWKHGASDWVNVKGPDGGLPER